MRTRWALLVIVVVASSWIGWASWRKADQAPVAESNRPADGAHRQSDKTPSPSASIRSAPPTHELATHGAALDATAPVTQDTVADSVIQASASEPARPLDELSPLENGMDEAQPSELAARSDTVDVPTESQSASPPPVDLLGLIDLERDGIKGDWQFDSGQLSSPPGVNQSRIQIPFDPPPEYTLRLVVERGTHGPYTTLGIGLVAGGRQFYLLLDSSEKEGSLGLDLLDGKNWNQNETTRRVKLFTDNVPAEVVCTVRASGLNVEVDGRGVLDWQGDYSRLSMYPAWAPPNRQRLFLGADCNYVISKLELAPLENSAAVAGP